MKSQVGVWVDHRQAHIVQLSDQEISHKTIESNAEEHIDEKRGSRSSSPYAPQEVFAENHADRRYQQILTNYYQDISKQLNKADDIYIFGPGLAKTELQSYLNDANLEHHPSIEIETTDKLTDVEITEKVKQHFHYQKEF